VIIQALLKMCRALLRLCRALLQHRALLQMRRATLKDFSNVCQLATTQNSCVNVQVSFADIWGYFANI